MYGSLDHRDSFGHRGQARSAWRVSSIIKKLEGGTKLAPMPPKQPRFKIPWEKSLLVFSKKQTSMFYSVGWTASISY